MFQYLLVGMYFVFIVCSPIISFIGSIRMLAINIKARNLPNTIIFGILTSILICLFIVYHTGQNILFDMFNLGMVVAPFLLIAMFMRLLFLAAS